MTQVRQSRRRWEDAYELFEAAQRERAKRFRRYSKEHLVTILRTIYMRYGRITGALIDQESDAPTPKLFAYHFGSLQEAYEAIGVPHTRNLDFIETRRRVYKIRTALLLEAERLILFAGAKCERLPSRYHLKLNDVITVCIQTLACRIETKYGYRRWQGMTPAAQGVDFTLAAQLDDTNTAIQRYILIGAADFNQTYYEFTQKSARKFPIQTTQLSELFGLPKFKFIC